MTYYNDQFDMVKPLGGYVTIKVYGEGATNHMSMNESQFEEFKKFTIALLNNEAEKTDKLYKELLERGEKL